MGNSSGQAHPLGLAGPVASGWIWLYQASSVDQDLPQSVCISFVRLCWEFLWPLCLPAASANAKGNGDWIVVCAGDGDGGGNSLFREPAWWSGKPSTAPFSRGWGGHLGWCAAWGTGLVLATKRGSHPTFQGETSQGDAAAASGLWLSLARAAPCQVSALEAPIVNPLPRGHKLPK